VVRAGREAAVVVGVERGAGVGVGAGVERGFWAAAGTGVNTSTASATVFRIEIDWIVMVLFLNGGRWRFWATTVRRAS
jgi:hypothetical protein